MFSKLVSCDNFRSPNLQTWLENEEKLCENLTELSKMKKKSIMFIQDAKKDKR